MNPLLSYQWWKGVAGQFYIAPNGISAMQRANELMKFGIITGGGLVGYDIVFSDQSTIIPFIMGDSND